MNLIRQLELAPTAADRHNLLPESSQWLYDFNSPPTAAITESTGGRTVKADPGTFPATIGNGVSMTVGFIGPCGFNTPHTHPRSSEFNIVVEGRLETQFQAENGVKPIENTLNKFQATIFPMGAIHTEFNPDCGNATFIAGFGNQDPGVLQSAQSFFGLNDEIVKAALAVDTINGADIDAFKGKIPANVALGVEECLAKCNIKKNY